MFHLDKFFTIIMMNVLQGNHEGSWDTQDLVCSFRSGNDNSYIQNLLDISSWENYTEETDLKSTVLNDWNEATSRWGDVVPNANYQIRRRRKTALSQQNSRGDDFAEDSDYGWVYSLFAKDEISSVDIHVKPLVRQLKEESWEESVSTFMGVSLWKACVEPGTYRYIPNNGVYRGIKFLKDKTDWYTVNKRHPERVNLSWQQKQIKREVKKQLEYHEKQCRAKSSAPECSKSKKSSPPSGALSAPAILKSTSDLYIQNFSTRLSVLDEEIRRDSKLMRMSHEEMPKSLPVPSIKKEPFVKIDQVTSPVQSNVNSSVKESKNIAKTPRELLSIKQFTKMDPIRPLLKVSPTYKKIDESSITKQSTDATSKISKETVNGSHGENVSPKNSFPADSFISGSKVIGGYRHKLDPDKSPVFNEGCNTQETDESDVNYMVKSLNSVINTTKITSPSRPRGSASVCSEDSTSKVITDGFLAAPVGRPKDRDFRQPSAKISTSESRAILPEISGKKLEVSMTNHRWL